MRHLLLILVSYFYQQVLSHISLVGLCQHRWRSTKQDLGIWNHLGVVVNWLLGACKMLGACKLDLGKHLGKHLGELLGACKLHL
jgi:hypothetical protein